MAYEVRYWESNGKADELIKAVRIGKVSEVIEEGLILTRPFNCSVVTLDRTDNQSPNYKVLWQHPNYVDLNER